MIHPFGEGKSLFTFKEEDSKRVQPNAFDFKIDRVFRFTTDTFELSADDKKVHRKQEEIRPDENGYYHLNSGVYGILTDVDCKIAEGEAGILIPRSSLNRNGIFLKSGLYDSGFDNAVGCTLYIQAPCFFKVQKGARIGQFLLFKAECLNLYNGSYNRV